MSGGGSRQAPPPRIAALYVDPQGVYAGMPDVELWDEARDARKYAGPYPVVAHPPCKSWSLMANCRPEIPKGEDAGCFEAALAAVRRWGGVLEHPMYSRAWTRFGLIAPRPTGWTKSLFDEGWVCAVDQAWNGHPANKRTWLYYVGPPPPDLQWGPAPFTGLTVRNDGGGGRDQRSKTPPAFRDVLHELARLSIREVVAA
jgi:hypothetical protein